MQKTKQLILLAAIVAAPVSQIHAQVSAVTSLAALPTTDTISWNQGPFAAEGYTPVSSPTPVTSAGGMTATVGLVGGGDLYPAINGSEWFGNFANGDAILYNGGQFTGNYAPLEINFSTPVDGAGAQIMDNYYGSFTATISAYDSLGNLLGSEIFNGTSSGADDGSAIFAGIDSTSADISSIVFSTVGNYDNNDFAIDTLDLDTTTPSSAPDAGSTCGLLGAAVLGLGALRRKLS